ncbi:MAG: OmpH family outer membrane protein [Alphaproteobacteria bacterium]|nr:OmpH family outer membrane protein [Alphaproteobacteria bacterium]
MNKLLCLSFLASVAMVPGLAKAETLPTPVIAIVEQATLDKSDALKSIVSQVDKKRAEIQKEMAKYESELKAQDKKLADEQKSLPEKEFADKRQAFEKRVREIQEKIEIRRAQMELAVEDSKKKVYEAFLKVADKVAKNAGANIVMYKETIVTAEPAYDLSAAALTELNTTLPTVPVVFKPEAEVKKILKQQAEAQQ